MSMRWSRFGCAGVLLSMGTAAQSVDAEEAVSAMAATWVNVVCEVRDAMLNLLTVPLGAIPIQDS